MNDMNRIEQNMFESIEIELNILRDNFNERSWEYSQLIDIVIDFFENLSENECKDECIDLFKNDLYTFSNIDIDYELEKRYNSIHLNNKSKSL